MSFAAPAPVLLDPALLGPPLAAGLLVLATHIPLGRRVLARGIVFLDLAIAQFAGLGVIVAHVADCDSGWGTQLVAFAAALAGAALLAWSDRRWPQRQEALISLNAKGWLPCFHKPEEIDADPADLPSRQGQVFGGRIGLCRRVVNLGGTDGPTGWGKQAKQQSHPDDHLIQGLDRGDANPSSAGSGTQGTRH